MGGPHERQPELTPPPAVPALPDHSGQPATPGGRWCPHCGADLINVPMRDPLQEEALFGAVGRRLKVAVAVGFVLVWLGTSIYDWFDDPSTTLLPPWFSALGALMLFYLLGLGPMMGLLRRR